MRPSFFLAALSLSFFSSLTAQTPAKPPGVVLLPPGASIQRTAAGMYVVLPDGTQVPYDEYKAAYFGEGQDGAAGQEPEQPVGAATEETPAKKDDGGDGVIAPYLQLKPKPRSAQQVLEALAQGPPAEPAADAPDAEKAAHGPALLQWRIQAGDWKGLREQILALDAPGKRKKLVDHLLQILQQPNVELTAEDVIGLADASPVRLSTQQLEALGKLFALAGRRSGYPARALGLLEAGTARLGGPEPEKRLDAARLLIAAQLGDEAQRFLPALETARANGQADVLLLHAEFLRGRAESGARQAFALVDEVLGKAELADADRDEGLRLAVLLLGAAEDEAARAWIDSLVREREPLARHFFLALARALGEIEMEADLAARAERLRVLQRVGDALAAGPAERNASFGEPLDLLCDGWLLEATHAIHSDGNVPNPHPPQSPRWFEVQTLTQKLQERRKRNVRPVAAEELLTIAPAPDWSERLQPDVAARLRRSRGLLIVSTLEEDRALACIREEASRGDDLARELVDTYLNNWIRKLGQRPTYYDNYSSMSYMGYSGSRVYYPNSGNGVPLTRARQERNLAELGRVASRFAELGLPFEDATLARAFGACHSPAEVYRDVDLERVFGDFTGLSPTLAVNLAGDMRRKLAGQWRKPSTQQQAGTRRTNKEIIAEVERGYDLCRDLLDQVANQVGDDSGLEGMQGAVLFDQAEFLYGQKVDLEIYVGLRQAAFEHFRRSADLYAEQVPGTPESRWSAMTWLNWFNAALGASDLAYLTRQEEPDLDEVQAVAASLRTVPDHARGKHLDLFAQQLAQRSSQVPAQLKPHYFRQALAILGENEAAAQVRETLQTYDELLGELELAWDVDGSARVGHGRPFGVRLSLRHTRSLERESGGFAKYMRNKVWSNRTGAQVDYRDLLEQRVREKLGESFEVVSAFPYEPEVGKLGDERFGWERTPLFYFVLEAKDPAVDRIPSVTMDVDFNDSYGYVLLPIESKPVLLDTRDADPGPRPFRDGAVTMVLDDRQLSKERRLRLEIRARGKGLVPALEDLLVLTAPEGFEQKNFADQGVTIVECDVEDELALLSERTWQVEYELPEDRAAPEKVAFPTPKLEGLTLGFQRYADADLAEVGPVVTLEELSFLSPRRWWPWALGLVGLLLLGGGLWFWQRRLVRAAAAIQRPRYTPVREASPFGAVALLRRLAEDPQLLWSPQQRGELRAEIDAIEREHFARESGAATNGELTQRVNRWIERASVGA